MIKVLTVVGTRPEAIKLAPVILELQRRPNTFLSRVCLTAQHREMAQQALDIFGIRPDHDLDAMSDGQTLSELTAKLLHSLDAAIAEDPPSVILVQGDTTTALCGALVGFYRQLPVGHVEAGLRTRDARSPFPEEMNRRLLGNLATLHFAPTTIARDELLKEGVDSRTIFTTGNTVVDALDWMRNRLVDTPTEISEELERRLGGSDVVLVTGHRRESFGAGLESICLAIRDVAEANEGVVFVYPVHLNPRVREPVHRILGSRERIHLLEPLPYGAFIWLMNRATIVLTDSGGIQEEAPSLGKLVLVMRDKTERLEGIASGAARLIGTNRQGIVTALTHALTEKRPTSTPADVVNPYGDGQAAKRIAEVLESRLRADQREIRPSSTAL